MPGGTAAVTGNDEHDDGDEPESSAPSGEGPQEIIDSARQEAEIPADETSEG